MDTTGSKESKTANLKNKKYFIVLWSCALALKRLIALVLDRITSSKVSLETVSSPPH